MENDFKQVRETALAAINTAKNSAEIELAFIKVFGKSGVFTVLTQKIKDIPNEQKPEFGRNLNILKKELEELLEKSRLGLKSQKTTKFIDITAPAKKHEIGHLHLVSQAIEEIVYIFRKIGFSLQSYPEIDWDWYAFESLNLPKDHPARDDWETFFVKSITDPKYGRQVLTPHTSNGQVREMERVKTPPVRMLNIARTYRRQVDLSHTPMFHQFEGLLVDKDVSIPNLKGTLDYFSTNFFGKNRVTRLRPHHFRFFTFS